MGAFSLHQLIPIRVLRRAIRLLRDRGHMKPGQLVAIVQSGRQPIWRTASTHAIQAGPSLSLCRLPSRGGSC